MCPFCSGLSKNSLLNCLCPLSPSALCRLAGLGVPHHEVCGVLKQLSPLLRRPRPGEVRPSLEARPCLPLWIPALPAQGHVSSSSASRCRVKAVLVHTPKGELVAAGEGGNLHLSLNSPWRLRPAPQCCHRPRACCPPAETFSISAGGHEATRYHWVLHGRWWSWGGPGSTWEATWLQFCCPSHWKTRSAQPWDGLFPCADRSRRTHFWLLEKGNRRPSSPPTVLSRPTWLCGWSWPVPLAGAFLFRP